MVDRDTFSAHMHVCPTVVDLLAGWKSNGLGGALLSCFFSSDSFVHVKCHDAEPGNPWMLKTEAN